VTAAGGLVSPIPTDALRVRLREADVALLDLDGSMHWGITQGVAAFHAFWRIAVRPERPSDRHFVLPLGLAGARLTAMQLNPGRPPAAIHNRRMIDVWCRTFRGVPMAYFRRAARHIPANSFTGVQQTITRLADRARVGIVSVGLEVIVREYVRQFSANGASHIAFYRCNRMETETRDGRETFAGTYQRPWIASPADKRRAGTEVMDALGARRPLLIGNDEGDVPLAHAVRERGGLAIGVAPPEAVRSAFDAWLAQPDWSPLAEMLG